MRALPSYSYLLVAGFFLLCTPLSVAGAAGDVALVVDKLKPALQGNAAAGNAQLATWNASTPLCLWRGLRWSTPAGRPLRCDAPGARANLSLATDASLLLTSIRLPAAALAGRLPPELGAFPALQSVYLAANSLSGEIPLELGNAPALSDLDLAGNALSGALPPSIWNLCDRLAGLRLHGNALTGAIPVPAGPNDTCDGLRVLDLGANRFSGDFPAFLTDFRGLRRLDLGGNRLEGPIPESLAAMRGLQMLNLSYNNFSGQLPPGFAASSFTAESFLGNSPALCGPPLQQPCVSPSGLSSGSVAGMVIGLMAGGVVLASVCIGWAQGRWRRNRVRRAAEEGVETEEGGEGKLVVFQGGEHLTLEEVLNATGQVVEKASYCTVYKAKLADAGGSIELRLLREGSCKDAASCGPAVRRIGRARHENLVPLRAFYQGRRGEKLLVYDYFPHRTLHDLLHGGGLESRPALTWPRRHKIALGAARALAYLHESRHGDAPVVHGNVRSSNVLVDEYFVPRVTEYAVVGRLLVPSAAEAVLSAAKSDGYCAPELLAMKRCAPRTDVYAFGILLLELLMGRKPSPAANGGDDLPSLVKAAVLEETAAEVFDPEVAKGVRSPAEEGLVQALKLAMGCCAPVAAARPSMAEVARQLEESRPKASRSALYSPAETRSEAGTPTTAA
ncbi:putative kinase-like protein TMKL1 [Hordeum vulgare subsp. vulgare]|uniref:Protein kinase domain-containing protein n=1 Tax=Hordeum vulgare subsp. vulgare TaxID=112509 RepID=A0A8I6WNH2_HORVV|nr:putative kinase-like protein TMKL1 [Hordeum vulgare subsp. vulgare]